jgi:hypothetical protein
MQPPLSNHRSMAVRVGFERTNPQVMNLTSYRAAPPRVNPAKTGSTGGPARRLCSNRDRNWKARRRPKNSAEGRKKEPAGHQSRLAPTLSSKQYNA